MDVLLDIRDSTPRGAHHLQRGRVQGACYVEPKEYLHVFDLGGERERAPLGATARLSLQVVEALEVVLQEGLTGTPDGSCGSREPGGCNKSSKVSARSSSLTPLTLRHTQKIFAILKEIYPEEDLRVIFFKHLQRETSHAVVQLIHLQWPASSQAVVQWTESFRPSVWLWAP